MEIFAVMDPRIISPHQNTSRKAPYLKKEPYTEEWLILHISLVIVCGNSVGILLAGQAKMYNTNDYWCFLYIECLKEKKEKETINSLH